MARLRDCTLAEIERRQALLRASSPETRRLAEQVASIDRNLSSTTLLPAQREALRQQRLQLEAQLYRLLPALKIDPVSNAQVATALKAAAPQGLLVEFQKYRPYEKDAKGLPNWGTARYVALLLKPEGTIRAIPLGEAKAIDEAVNTALTATVKNEQRQTQALAVLSQRVLGPLQPHLSGMSVLFLSPDAELNRVPFAALPSPADPGRYLSEAFQLRILTTGRDLVRLQQPIKNAGGQTAASNVLMADPDYGPISSTSSTPSHPAWLPLPYTRAEAEQIKGLLNVRQPFLGKEATAALVLRSRGPRMLHIATHGYFQPEAVNTEGPRLKASRFADGSGFAPAQLNQPNSQLQLENQEPLQRIYLALAGANIPAASAASAADDGRLTAAEATGMDLAGTELVTLSACDTARGEIRSGEGVYGLQRALTVAGARSTLLSLWRVSDERTAVFMSEFYKRIKAGQPRADALRDTQAFFRKHPDPTYRDVYAWGGFQLTGDWRPVEGL
ncbi:MAG: CHAT domain-containing protein [Cyanobacteriota bacterium]